MNKDKEYQEFRERLEIVDLLYCSVEEAVEVLRRPVKERAYYLARRVSRTFWEVLKKLEINSGIPKNASGEQYKARISRYHTSPILGQPINFEVHIKEIKVENGTVISDKTHNEWPENCPHELLEGIIDCSDFFPEIEKFRQDYRVASITPPTNYCEHK